MSRFDELNSNLMSILLKMIDNKNLCKLVNYNSYDPLSETDMIDSSTLLFDKNLSISFHSRRRYYSDFAN